MPLGPLTRAALIEAGIDDRRLAGIDDGTLEWSIGLASAIGISADEELARRTAEEIAARQDFALTIRRTEAAQRERNPYNLSPRARRVYEAAIPNALGVRIARARRYEEALAARGEAESVLFQHGTVDDWINVAPAASWDAVAFEFRRAAEAVAATHTAESPAPVMPLLSLCRHHLELALKAIIMRGDELFGAQPNLPTTHHLTPLWARAEPLMRRAWRDGLVDAEVASARDVVIEFDNADRTSMATRYPVDRNNVAFARSAPLTNFSVTQFVASFAQAADLLGTALLWIEIGLRLRGEGTAPPEAG